MCHNNDKRRLYKKSILIGAIVIIFLISMVEMVNFRYEVVKEYINNFIKVISNIDQRIVYYINGFFEVINKTYLELSKIFNNRELAMCFWIIVFIGFSLSIKDVRKQLLDMKKILFSKSLMIWYICIVSYFLMMIIILIKLGFWDKSLLKDTIIWFITVGIISCGKAIGKAKDLKYFIDVIKDNIKLLIILEFVSNLYSFSFIKEVILIFTIVFISMLIAVIDVNPQFKDKNSQGLKNFLNTVLAIIGLYIVYHSIRLLIVNIQEVDVEKLVKEMLLPTILSIMFIFFTYLYVIYAAYEQLFIRLSFKKTIDDKIRNSLTIRILLFCNLNIIRINNFILRSQIMNSYVTSKEDIKNLLVNYNNYEKNSVPSFT